MTQAFSPTEIFKRATASTLRAIAERDDVTVGFGPEPPGVAGPERGPANSSRNEGAGFRCVGSGRGGDCW